MSFQEEFDFEEQEKDKERKLQMLAMFNNIKETFKAEDDPYLESDEELKSTGRKHLYKGSQKTIAKELVDQNSPARDPVSKRQFGYGDRKFWEIEYDDKNAQIRHEERLRIEKGSFLVLFPEKDITRIQRARCRCYCFFVLKWLVCSWFRLRDFCKALVSSPVFETVSLGIIIFNSITLAIEEPSSEENNSADGETWQSYFSTENFFIGAYTLEMALKIIGTGLIFNQGAYLRSSWNILDGTIVLSSYFSLFGGSGALSSLQVLRSLRVLRPLRTISSIKSLKNLISTIISSLPYLRDISIVILFFFLIMAIAGLQLFSGSLKNHCIFPETGALDSLSTVCGTQPVLMVWFAGKAIRIQIP